MSDKKKDGDEDKKDLNDLSPDELVKKLKNQQEALDRVVSQRDELRQKMQQADSTLKEFQEWKDKQSKIEEEKEREKLEQKGEYEKALNEFKASKDKEIQKLTSKFKDYLVPALAKSAVSSVSKKYKLVENAIPDVVENIKRNLDIDLDSMEVYVKDSDGKKKVREGSLEPMSVDEFADKYIQERDFLILDKTPIQSGKKKLNDNDDPRSHEFTYENAKKNPEIARKWQEKDPEGFAKAAQDAVRNKIGKRY